MGMGSVILQEDVDGSVMRSAREEMGRGTARTEIGGGRSAVKGYVSKRAWRVYITHLTSIVVVMSSCVPGQETTRVNRECRWPSLIAGGMIRAHDEEISGGIVERAAGETVSGQRNVKAGIASGVSL
jgi:hypothetical protein